MCVHGLGKTAITCQIVWINLIWHFEFSKLVLIIYKIAKLVNNLGRQVYMDTTHVDQSTRRKKANKKPISLPSSSQFFFFNQTQFCNFNYGWWTLTFNDTFRFSNLFIFVSHNFSWFIWSSTLVIFYDICKNFMQF